MMAAEELVRAWQRPVIQSQPAARESDKEEGEIAPVGAPVPV